MAHLYTGAPFLVAGNGSHTVTYWSTDGVGNVEATHTGYVNIDTSAPVTTATGLQAGNQSGWQNVSQVVSLGANDALSGVAATYYTLDGATQTYTNPFTVSAQGSHLITYWSVDAVGNIETANTGYVNIDTTAPTVTDDADGLWHDSPVPVHLSPIDTGGSGLAGTQYRLQGASSWSAAVGNVFVVPAPPGGAADGVHVYQYRALDNAGNSSSIGSCTVWIDTTPPTTTATGLAADDLSGWRTTSQTVSLSPDDGSGSGVTSTSYTVDGGGPQTYTGSFTVSGTGQHPVTYWSTDAAGNVETTHTGWVNISNPYAQATNLVADNDSGWRNAATTVTITGSGDHVPIAVWYGVDGATPTQAAANPASFTESVEGSHRVDFYATNNLNVQSAQETGYVNIDLTPPTTTASGLQANNHSGWQTTSQSVTLSATDALSGVATTYYTIDGGAAQLYVGGPFLVGGEGSHRVTYWSVDAAGNIETTHTGFVNIDTTPPVTTATGLQADDHSGWTKTTPQTVSLSATDGGSGMSGGSAATYYTIDGVQHTYSGSFTVSAEGSHTVTYWSVDAVGNIEGTHTGYVNIDLTPPVTTATGLQADNHSGWATTTPQTVSLSATDGGSGMSGGSAATYYTIDGVQHTYGGSFTVTAEGSHTIVYWSVDNAGNIETSHTGFVNIDLTPPVTTAGNLQANGHSGWTKTTPQTVTLSATDGGSGMSGGSAATYYTIDGVQHTYGGSFAVTAEGSHTIVYWSVDNAGNIETSHTGFVNIDLTPPVTAATGLQANNNSGWQNTSQTVTLTGDDGSGSGVATTHYTIDGVSHTYTSPFTVSGQGSHIITYWSTDAAGNTETTNTGYVNIDTTAPTVMSSADSDTAWHNSAVTVQLSPADSGGSGVADTQYRLHGSSTWLETTGNAFVVPAPSDGSNDGAHVYDYQALDAAGNASSARTCTVKIDTQGPVVTPSGLQPDDITGWQTTSQTVSLSANDGGGSGVASISYSVDGVAQPTYSAPFTVSVVGQHPVVYWATDALGNVSAPKTGWVNISNPFAQATGLAPDTHSDWQKSGATVTITGSGDHGPFTIYYKLDAGAWQNVASPASVPVSGEGNHTIAFYAVNSVSAQSVHQTGYVNIDATAPTTTATGLQANNHSGWQTANQSVTLSATDALSGVAATTYTVDGGAAQTYTGTPILVSGSGSHTVTYQSVDNAGNTEGTHTGYVNIDTTPPVTTATGLALDDDSDWTANPSPSVTLSASDGGSGMTGSAATYYTVDGGDQTTYAGSFTVTGEGSHTVTYWSVDALGNQEATNTGFVNIDLTPPVTTATGLQASNSSGWQNTSQMVTLTGDDGGGSGVTVTHYTVDGVAQPAYSGPFTVSGQGSHIITYWSVDTAGNTEATNTGYVNIDTTLPTVTSSADSDSAWHNSAVTVTLSPADTGGSGVADTQYRLHGSSTWLEATGNAFVVPAPSDGSNDGAHVYDYQALDGAGNASSARTCTVKIDTQAPVTTATGLQANNYSGWQNTSQTVSLSGTDATSGSPVTHYTVNGGAQQTYSAPFSVSSAGTNKITYWSVDAAGNTETTNTGYVNIDTTAPTVMSSADSDTAWHNSAVTVQLSPADSGGSGVADTQYRLHGSATWLEATGNAFVVPAPSDGSGDGANVYDYQALDGAGNASATGTCTVRIDTQAPVTTATGLQPNNYSGWQKTNQDVTLTPDDGAGSGVAITYYTVDGGARQTYSTKFTVSGAGRHRVMYWSTDHAGNIETPHIGYVNIDTSPPATTATGLNATADCGWQNAPQLVSLDAEDGLSGVAATDYTLDGGATQPYTGPFTISANGQHTVTYWSVDAVGNSETPQSGFVNIDTAAPVTSAGTDPTGWTNGLVTVTLSATDTGGSGLDTTYYQIGASGPPQIYTVPFSVSDATPVSYWSTDLAGNIEGANTLTPQIDTTPPTVTSSADADATWHRHDVTVTLTASDSGGSGVAKTQYKLHSDSTWTDTSAGTFVVPATTDGSFVYDYRAIDGAGNETTGSCTVNIDTTPPVTTAAGLQLNDHSGWQNTSQMVSLSATDGGSGMTGGSAATYYTINGGARQTYSAPFAISSEGTHAIVYWSVDNAGNTESTNTGWVNIDTTPPTTTATGLAADDLSGWRTTSQTVSLSADDGSGSGVTGTSYSVDGGGPQTYTGSFTVSGTGQHPVTYWSTDAAGNVEATHTGWVNISNPYAQATNLAADNDSGWRNAATTVTITGSGDQPPFTIHYKLDAGSWQIVPSAASVPVSSEGSHTVVFYAVNNVSVQSVQETGYVNIDLTPPTTTATGLQANDHSGWQTTSQSVTLSASDALSGVATTYYTIDGVQHTYSGSFTVSTPGSHRVTYWSVDAAGNIEGTHTGFVNIDTTPPVTTATGLQADDHSGWTKTTPQTVSLSASDGESGMSGGSAATYYTIDGVQHTYSGSFSVSAEGSHTVTYWSVDAVGNIEGFHTGYVNIDLTPPVTTATGLQANNHSGWRNTSQMVTLTGDDGSGSGVASISYTVDGGAAQTYSGPFTVSGAGQHAVTFAATDAAGNIEATKTGWVNIDTTAPTTTQSGLQIDDLSGWRTTSQTVSLSATDTGGSGVASISYTVDGGAAQTYSAPFTVSGFLQHQVTYWATDAAGNVEATHTGWVNISNPYTTVTNLAANNHSGWHKSATTVTITGSGDSGPFTIHYKVDTGSWQSVPSAASVVVSGQGSHTVAFYAVNSVSASSIHQTGYVNIDLTRPATTATGLQANNHSGWRTTSRTVTFAATDAGCSGVAHTYYKLGSGSQQTYTGTPVQISGQGSHAVTYWSVDAAGNIETSHTGYVNIDTTPPTVTSNADSLWHNSPVTVKLKASDALSGVASTQYRAQGSSTWTVAAGNAFVVPAPANGSNDGAHVYQYRALDQAGNASATGTCTVRIDTQGPTVTNDADSYWHNSAVTVHLAAADTNAGVASVSYRLTGTTSWTTTSGATAQITVPVPADGQPHRYSYDYQATDKAGNLSAVKTLVVLIDPSMPNTTVAGLPANAMDQHAGVADLHGDVGRRGADRAHRVLL